MQRSRKKNATGYDLRNVVVGMNTTMQRSRRNKGKEQGTEKLTKTEKERGEKEAGEG